MINHFIRTHQEEMSVCEDELRIAQAEQKEILEKKRKHFAESSQVDRLVKSLLQDQTRKKNKIDENREIIESCNDSNINTFVSIIFIYLRPFIFDRTFTTFSGKSTKIHVHD